jgi:hypothetical protein
MTDSPENTATDVLASFDEFETRMRQKFPLSPIRNPGKQRPLSPIVGLAAEQRRYEGKMFRLVEQLDELRRSLASLHEEAIKSKDKKTGKKVLSKSNCGLEGD